MVLKTDSLLSNISILHLNDCTSSDNNLFIQLRVLYYSQTAMRLECPHDKLPMLDSASEPVTKTASCQSSGSPSQPISFFITRLFSSSPLPYIFSWYTHRHTSSRCVSLIVRSRAPFI